MASNGNYALGGRTDTGMLFKNGEHNVTKNVDISPTLVGNEKYRADCNNSCKTACNGCLNGCENGCGTACGDGCEGSCRIGCFGGANKAMVCDGCGMACMGSCYSSCGECGGCSGLCHTSTSSSAVVRTSGITSAATTSKCAGCGVTCAASALAGHDEFAVTAKSKIGGGN